MVMRVERRGDEYCVVIPQQALEALQLTEGAEVEMLPVSQSEKPSSIQYVSVEEALEAYRATLPQHHAAYLELAK